MPIKEGETATTITVSAADVETSIATVRETVREMGGMYPVFFAFCRFGDSICGSGEATNEQELLHLLYAAFQQNFDGPLVIGPVVRH